MIKEGKIPAKPPHSSSHPPSFGDSEATYDVLPEVLQAQARIDAPNAARRKEFEVRIKGEPLPLTEDELRRYRTTSYAVSAAVGHVPRLSLSGRNRYGIPPSATATSGGGGSLVLHSRTTLSPEAAEVARRSYMAGVRALVYGSLLGLGLVAAGSTFAVQYFGIGTGGDFRLGVQEALIPLRDAVRARIEPLKARAEKLLKREGGSSSGSGNGTSALQERLRDRYNPSAGGGNHQIS